MKIKLKSFKLSESIEKVINDQRLTKAEVAKRLGKDQSYFIKKYTKNGNIAVMELYELSQALDYNFFADFCEYPEAEDILDIAGKIGYEKGSGEIWERYREEIIKNDNLQKKVKALEEKLSQYEELNDQIKKAG